MWRSRVTAGLTCLLLATSGCHPFQDADDYPFPDDHDGSPAGLDGASHDLSGDVSWPPDTTLLPDGALPDQIDVIDPSVKEAVLCDGCGPDWWDVSWHARLPIAVLYGGHDRLQAFPLLIDVEAPIIGVKAQSGGGDFRVLTDSGELLVHDLESFDPSTGRVRAWVRVPRLEPGTPVRLDLYFGNGAALPIVNSTDVWDGFSGVWHFNEGTLLDDASPNANHGGEAATRLPTLSSGAVGQGVDFDGSGQRVTVPYTASLQLTNALTISFWATFRRFAPSASLLVAKDTGYGTTNNDFYVRADGALIGSVYVEGSGAPLNYPGGFSMGDWHHVAYTFDGEMQLLYLDGQLVAMGTRSGAIASMKRPVHFGAWAGPIDPSRSHDGLMDEVRIAPIARSRTWVAFSYLNQRDPTSTIALGSVELAP